MWREALRAREREGRRALRGALRTVDELWPDEYEEALVAVNEYLKKHDDQRRFLERDHGPGSAAEARERPALAAYNGQSGGRFFMWYKPGNFLQELKRDGVDVETCTEGQCIRALKATSEALYQGPAHAGLVPYAGPQCYPQLKERLWANAPQQMETAGRGPKRGAVKVRAGTEDEDLRVLAEQFENCWMRCDDCGARRLVERGSAASLRSESFQKVTEGSEAGFWGQWLREARSRHDAFLEKWSEKKPGGPISQQQFCVPCEQEQGSGEGPEGGGERVALTGKSVTGMTAFRPVAA